MVKLKQTSSFVCQECGYDTPKFMGKCPECNEWNTFKEIKLGKSSDPSAKSLGVLNIDITPKKVADIVYSETSRTPTKFDELNTVLGGGIVAGSVTLLA